MRRRDFLAGFGITAAYPLASNAQRAAMPTVGVLMAGAENSSENKPRIDAFRQALADLGWKDGENIDVIYRWSTGKRELIDQYAKELVALKPDVILANSTPVISTFKSMTSTIPVVFALSMDPVGLGQVQSLSHPGGNFTGFTFVDPELVGKWMQLLHDLVPGLMQAALLYNPQTVPAYTRFVEQVRAASRSGSVTLKDMPVTGTQEMEVAIGAHNQGRAPSDQAGSIGWVRLKQVELALAPTAGLGLRPFVEWRSMMSGMSCRTSSAAPPPTSTACSRAKSRPTCLCNSRTNSSSSSTSRPPRRSALPSLRCTALADEVEVIALSMSPVGPPRMSATRSLSGG